MRGCLGATALYRAGVAYTTERDIVKGLVVRVLLPKPKSVTDTSVSRSGDVGLSGPLAIRLAAGV